jgi:hypothetical protein
MKLQLLMVVASGFFAAGTIAAAVRIRACLGMNLTDFKRDFARTIGIADKVQPALVIVSLIVIVSFVVTSGDPGERYALGAGVVFLAILVASVAILVPLQKKIIRTTESREATEALRMRWMKGHLGRTMAAIVAFALAIATFLA